MTELSDNKVSVGTTSISLAKPTNFAVNAIQPGRSKWFEAHIHEMSMQVLKRHLIEYENMLNSYREGNLPLTVSDRMEIDAIVTLLQDRLDEIMPKMPADIADHDSTRGWRTALDWPAHLPQHTLKIHYHFCELLTAWNLNPNRRDTSTVTIDESAEALGITRFVFCSNKGRDDFLDFFSLDDFVVRLWDDGTYAWLELTNKFNKAEAEQFLTTLRECVNMLSVIQEERNRAIRNDNGKIGYVLVEHFTSREFDVLLRIKQARSMLGMGVESRGGK
ncbi:hypothetical protein [Streptomyces griseosporeus]|uniref:hypothetical protein n=1 Tax=Streptomyces griseosporeus TaxID=1910 RepID=UPI00167D267B|nr:hypothetical protein [Streptomyces griseosporeus]GHF92409.1 hypothetical protein GCM10018783_74150 [Streptomyces griseosporeus]